MAGGTIEKIQVILQSMTSKFASGMDIASTRMKRFGKNMNEFGGVMKAPMERFKGFNKGTEKLNTVGGRLANRFRLMTHGLRGFRMEMLGVMFFGMMLQRTFVGLLRPVMDAFGVFDLFRIMLLTLFLPVMDMLFPILLKVMEFFIDLPEPTKKMIGIFVLLGAALGGLLFLVGSFALGIGSLILVFGSLVTPIGLVLAGLTAIGALVFLPKLFKWIADNVSLADEKLTGFGITGINLSGMVDKIGEILPKIKEKLLEKFEVIKEIGKVFAEGLVAGITKFFSENPLSAVGGLIGAFLGGPAGAAVGLALGNLFGKLDLSKMDEIIEKGKEVLDGLMDGLIKNKDKISEAFEKIISFIGDWIGNNLDKIMELGIAIGKGIVRGIAQAMLNIGGAIGNFLSGKGFITEGAPQLDQIGIQGFNAAGISRDQGSVNITNNFEGFTNEDLKREIDNSNRSVVDEIRRQTK